MKHIAVLQKEVNFCKAANNFRTIFEAENKMETYLDEKIEEVTGVLTSSQTMRDIAIDNKDWNLERKWNFHVSYLAKFRGSLILTLESFNRVTVEVVDD